MGDEREVVGYAITYAPKGVKGGPYEGPGDYGTPAASLRDAERWKAPLSPSSYTLARVRQVHPHARVIRIVRKARPLPSEASAVEALRDMLSTWDRRGFIRIEAVDHARAILAASGPDPSEVVRAAMAWSEADRTNGVVRTTALQLVCDAFRKAGGK